MSLGSSTVTGRKHDGLISVANHHHPVASRHSPAHAHRTASPHFPSLGKHAPHRLSLALVSSSIASHGSVLLLRTLITTSRRGDRHAPSRYLSARLLVVLGQLAVFASLSFDLKVIIPARTTCRNGWINLLIDSSGPQHLQQLRKRNRALVGVK